MPSFLRLPSRRRGLSRTAPLLILGLLLLVPAATGLVTRSAHAFSNGQSASAVLGQLNFGGVGQTRANGPEGVTFDSSGNLWVADYADNRVLKFIPPFANGMSASLVLGQPDFVSSAAATTQSGMSGPAAVGFDSSGNLWVVDSNNHRVLSFSPPFSNGMNANLVIGQTFFTTSLGYGITTASSVYYPNDARFDSIGNLWVADCGNDRVLRYSSPFTSGMSANLVLGQSDFGSYASATTQSGMYCPAGLAFDPSGNLWVSDFNNNRILRFTGTFTMGMNANLVIGQSGYTTRTSSSSQNGLAGPWGMAFDPSGNLWVVDANNYRVLAFAPPFSTAASALLVIGAPGFSASTSFGQTWFSYPAVLAFDPSGNLWVSDDGNGVVLRFSSPFSSGQAASLLLGQGQNTLTRPAGLFIDSSGNLWVADNANDRVLRFVPPFSNGMNANLVLGQSGFGTNVYVPTQRGLTGSWGVTQDSSGKLWVFDSSANRILRFSPPFSNGSSADLVVGQSDFTSSAPHTTQAGLNYSSFIAFDASGNLWVSDNGNNRVLRFSPPFTTGMSANLVIGQSSFTTDVVAASQNGFNNPFGMAFDSAGNLWVSDFNNNRVLRFSPPFSNGMSANLVLGQSSYTANALSTTQNGMYHPEGLAFDPRGNLWVADYSNNRVLRFSPPFATAMSANLVLGQSGFVTRATATGPNGMNHPRQPAVDSAGNVWITERYNNRVMKFVCGSECPPSTLAFSYGVQGGGTGVSAPTLTYMSGGIPLTATLTSTPTTYSIDYGSAWTITNTLTGSTAAERWATNQVTSGTATSSQTLSLTYYHQFNVSLGFTVSGGGSGYAAPSVNCTQFGAQVSASAGSTTWVDSGSTYSYQSALPGSTSTERWFTGSASGSVSSAAGVSPSYYHQYALTAPYTISGGGSPSPPTLTSTSLGRPSSTVLSTTAQSIWLDSGSSYSVTNPLGGSSSTERWYTSAASGTVAAPITRLLYYHQFLVTSSFSVIGGGSPSPPILSMTALGVQSSATLTTTATPIWMDAGSSYSLSNPLPSSTASERWQTPTTSTGSAASAITLNAAYYHQYFVAVSYAVAGGGSPSAPAFAYSSFGASSSVNLTPDKQSIWVDGGSQYSATNPLAGSTSSERWQSQTSSGPVTSSSPIVLQYSHQYSISFAVTDSSGRTKIVPSVFSINVQGTGEQSVQGLASWLNNGASFTISRLVFQGLDVKPAPTQYSVTGSATIAVKALLFDAIVKVSDLLGLPVSGADVKMTLANGTTIAGTTGGDGTFVAQAIPLGTFTASVSGIGSSSQVTGDASKQSVTSASVLFSTTSIGVIVGAIVIVALLAVFMLRRRSGRGAAKPAKAAQTKALSCPNCGSSVDPSDPFCPNCGNKLH